MDTEASPKRPRKHKLAKWLVGCLGVVFFGWLLHRAPIVREAELAGLSRLGASAVPLILKAMQDDDAQVRKSADEALVRIGLPAMPRLITALEHGDVSTRTNAARVLWSLRTLGVRPTTDKETQALVTALIKALNDAEPRVRENVVEGLANIGTDAVTALPGLLTTLNDPDSAVRKATCSALCRIRPHDPNVVSALIAALKDADVQVRVEVCHGLSEVGKDHPAAVNALIARLRDDPHPDVRAEAVEALKDIGPAAKVAIPAITAALNDPNERVRDEAEEALDVLKPRQPSE